MPGLKNQCKSLVRVDQEGQNIPGDINDGYFARQKTFQLKLQGFLQIATDFSPPSHEKERIQM